MMVSTVCKGKAGLWLSVVWRVGKEARECWKHGEVSITGQVGWGQIMKGPDS